MEYYVVIDTSVLLSVLLSKNENSSTVNVLVAVFEGKIIPLYHQDILVEYDDAYFVTSNKKHYPFRDFIIWWYVHQSKQMSIE